MKSTKVHNPRAILSLLKLILFLVHEFTQIIVGNSDIQVVLADPQVGKDSDIQVVLAGTGSHWLTSTYVHDHFMCAYTVYVCLPGLWLGGLLHLSFLSVFLKLVCCAHVFSCTMFSLAL